MMIHNCFCVNLNEIVFVEPEIDEDELLSQLSEIFFDTSRFRQIEVNGFQIYQHNQSIKRIHQFLARLFLICKLNLKVTQLTINHCLQNIPISVNIIQKISFSCRFLVVLNLSFNSIGDLGVAQIRKSEFKFLQFLELNSVVITEEGALEISRGQWKYLTNLSLAKNSMKNKGLKHLLRNSDWKRLEYFNIQDNSLTKDGINLFSRQRWPQLIILDLGLLEVKDQIQNLLNRVYFPKLCLLLHESTGFTYTGLAAKMPLRFNSAKSTSDPLVPPMNLIHSTKTQLTNSTIKNQLLIKRGEFQTE